MKKPRKKISALILSLCIGTSLLPVGAFAAAEGAAGATAPSGIVQVIQAAQPDGQIVPYSYIIDWRYKSENNKVYRRLYNYSKQQWIGEWELC